MKALKRRLEKLETARRPVVDEWGQTLRERLERGLQRVRDSGHVSNPAPQWAVDRLLGALRRGAPVR